MRPSSAPSAKAALLLPLPCRTPTPAHLHTRAAALSQREWIDQHRVTKQSLQWPSRLYEQFYVVVGPAEPS